MKPPKPLLFLPSLLLCLTAPAEIIERVVVKVNGDIVTLSEFQNRQVAAVQSARIEPDKIEAFLRENNARILQDAVDDLLLVQRAAELGFRLRPDFIKDQIETIKKENNLASDEALIEQLRREGMSLDDLKRNLERSILKRQVLSRDLETRMVLTEDDVRADYQARLADYTKAETVELQEILVSGGAAQALAAQIVDRARAGEDFAALARAFSSDPTRDAGGDMGRFARGELAAALDGAAFSLPLGAISEPIASVEGLRILRIKEKTPGSVTPFYQVKAEIRERLTREKWGHEYDRYIADLRKSGAIDVRVREVPLQVSVPTEPSAFLEPPSEPGSAPPPPAGAPADPNAEILTATPQAKPQHVAPPPKPTDEPSPSPAPRP